MKHLLILLLSIGLFSSCDWSEPGEIGVLMKNYGRNGKEDFSIKTGKIWTLAPGTELIKIPTVEQRGDIKPMEIKSKNSGKFTVDPSYGYRANKEEAINIVFSYKQIAQTSNDFVQAVEDKILDIRVRDAYRQVFRNYSTEYIMNNANIVEAEVDSLLSLMFTEAYFTLTSLTSSIDPPESIKSAIEARDKAVEEANTLRNQLEKERVALAKDSIALKRAKIQKAINLELSQGLTRELLEKQRIEAWKAGGSQVPKVLGSGEFIIDFKN